MPEEDSSTEPVDVMLPKLISPVDKILTLPAAAEIACVVTLAAGLVSVAPPIQTSPPLVSIEDPAPMLTLPELLLSLSARSTVFSAPVIEVIDTFSLITMLFAAVKVSVASAPDDFEIFAARVISPSPATSESV